MHQCGDFLHFTLLKEEPSIIDRLVQAGLQPGLTSFQAETIRLMYEYLVVKNFDIRVDTFSNFQVVLAQLGIEQPTLHIRITDGKHRGSRPRLPDPKTDPVGFQKQKQKRALKRLCAFKASLNLYQISSDEFVARLTGHRVDPIEAKITAIKTKVDQITDHFDQSFLDFLKKMGIDETHPKAAEVKQNFLRLVVNNDR
jgi:hypothetical protein